MVTDRQTRAMLAVCTAIIVSAALYFASSILAPFAFALSRLSGHCNGRWKQNFRKPLRCY